MIPLLSLIISAYCIVRLIQAPLEMSTSQQQAFGLPFDKRLLLVAMLSTAGVAAIAILAAIASMRGL